MKSNKQLLNQTPVNESCHMLSDQELHRLQKTLLNAYKDIEACCEKHGLSIAMTGGNAIGAIRHKGFIPWDDDVDLMMTRDDYEVFKEIFDSELGKRYVLNAPNFSVAPTNRFAKILIKGTRFVELDTENDERACIKLDLFVLENIPNNRFIRLVKGHFCNALMLIASSVETYEYDIHHGKSSFTGTKEGLKRQKQMVFIGRLFAFRNKYKWLNSVDKHCQYKHATTQIGTTTGSFHYFGTIMNREIILPFRKVPFEETTVYIPKDYDIYLTRIFGNYMEIPPVDKREHHFVSEIRFSEEGGQNS